MKASKSELLFEWPLLLRVSALNLQPASAAAMMAVLVLVGSGVSLLELTLLLSNFASRDTRPGRQIG